MRDSSSLNRDGDRRKAPITISPDRRVSSLRHLETEVVVAPLEAMDQDLDLSIIALENCFGPTGDVGAKQSESKTWRSFGAMAALCMAKAIQVSEPKVAALGALDLNERVNALLVV